MKRERIKGSGTPAPLAHYCQGVLAGDTLYAAGQIASDYKTGVPAGPDIRKQTRYVLENIAAVYRAAGYELAQTVKAQAFLTDLAEYEGFEEVWREFFRS